MSSKFLDQSKCFSSGPCAKRTGWTLDSLQSALLGRSHRSTDGILKIKNVIELIKQTLEIPDDYFVALTPGGITGSVEMGLWNLLGQHVTCISFDPFGDIWHDDIKNHMNVQDVDLIKSEYGTIPDLQSLTLDYSRDIVFTHAATTTAAMLDNFNWITNDRTGLTFCDAAASAFSVKMDWDKLDVTSFGFQKGLGCEAGHGIIVLSPRAMERFRKNQHKIRAPRIIRMNEKIFEGYTVNTPSMLCIEEYYVTLKWVQEQGGMSFLNQRSLNNKNIVDAWLSTQKYLKHLCDRRANQAIMNSCLVLLKNNSWEAIKHIVNAAYDADIGYDILGHISAYPCIRVWHGPTTQGAALSLFLNNLQKIMD